MIFSAAHLASYIYMWQLYYIYWNLVSSGVGILVYTVAIYIVLFLLSQTNKQDAGLLILADLNSFGLLHT